jgi:NTE family protein
VRVTLGIAFEGCACKAAFHVGAVERLSELGVRLVAASGASSGSILAAGVALERSHELRAQWEALSGRTRVFQPGRLLRARWPYAMSDILRGALEEHMGEQRLAEATHPLAIVVTHLGLSGRRRRTLTHEDDVSLIEAILGSSFIPGPYARFVRVGGRLAMDGAWQVRTPIDEARALGATRVIACVSDPAGRLIEGFPFERVRPTPPWVRVLHPAQPLALAGFDFDQRRTQDAFASGRRGAEVFFEAQREWLEAGEALA